jgi:hypothetical protein
MKDEGGRVTFASALTMVDRLRSARSRGGAAPDASFDHVQPRPVRMRHSVLQSIHPLKPLASATRLSTAYRKIVKSYRQPREGWTLLATKGEHYVRDVRRLELAELGLRNLHV